MNIGHVVGYGPTVKAEPYGMIVGYLPIDATADIDRSGDIIHKNGARTVEFRRTDDLVDQVAFLPVGKKLRIESSEYVDILVAVIGIILAEGSLKSLTRRDCPS